MSLDMVSNTLEEQAFKRALQHARKQFDDLLRSLPKETASDVKELFRLLVNAEDESEKAEIASTIGEILCPQSIKIEINDDFTKDDPEVRERVDYYRRKVGHEIKRRRELLGLTQEQLGEKAGIPQTHVCRLERGIHVPTFKTLEKVAKALDTTPAQLDPGFYDEVDDDE